MRFRNIFRNVSRNRSNNKSNNSRLVYYEYRLTVDNQDEPVPNHVTDVIVEEGVTIIQVRTFSQLNRLRSIALPQSLQELEFGALHACPSLKSIFIPRNVTCIGKHAFCGCLALVEVIFEEGSKLKTIHAEALCGCRSLKSIRIPKSVTTLGLRVFLQCKNLQSVIFEEGSQLQVIPENCFFDCIKLKSMIIPDSVTTIQEKAFGRCFDLTFIFFTPQSKLQHIDEEVFHNCPILRFINIPTTIISIHHTAFDLCDALPINVTSTSTSTSTHPLNWFQQQRFCHLPLHQLCYTNIHGLTKDELSSIESNDPRLIEQDRFGVTPLHIVCCNPQSSVEIIEEVYNKNHDAATIVNVTNMTPWHMYLIAKGLITYGELHAMIANHNNVENSEARDVSRDVSRAIWREDAIGNNIHGLIGMGLDYDVYRVTLSLHGVIFYEECNRFSEITGLYPFMLLAASNQYTLCDLYDIVMKTGVENLLPKIKQHSS
jgi:hypothetical protein